MTLTEATAQAEEAAAQYTRLQRQQIEAGERLSEALAQLLAVLEIEKASNAASAA